MAISNFRVVAYPEVTASGPEDLDHRGDPILDSAQQCELDQAQRMVKHCAGIMTLLEALAMSAEPQAGAAADHGQRTTGGADGGGQFGLGFRPHCGAPPCGVRTREEGRPWPRSAANGGRRRP